jgi:hypothetical protein
LVGLPLIHLSRIYYNLRGWTDYPISFILLEAAGNLAGPWSLWVSRRRVKRIGRSSFFDSTQQAFSCLDIASTAILNTKDPYLDLSDHNAEAATIVGTPLISSIISEQEPSYD